MLGGIDIMHSNILKLLELSQMDACRMYLEAPRIQFLLAQQLMQLVLMEASALGSSAKSTLLSNLLRSMTSSMTSTSMALLVEACKSTMIFGATSQVSILQLPIKQVWDVMPSRSSDGVLRTAVTTGCVLTHGALTGDCRDTSRSSRE